MTGKHCRAETDKIGAEFDEDACDYCGRYKRTGLSKSSKVLLDLILKDDLHGKSIADLGCGTGGFTVQLLKEGANAAVGFDLSPKMIESAKSLAIENGFGDKANFQLGNAATAEVPSSDIVILDKVLYCFSDWKLLLENAMGASRRIIGFIVPRDQGIAKIPFRIGVQIVNYFQKRRGDILFYLHPLDQVDQTLRDSGFVRREKKPSRFWLVYLYARDQSMA
jgi:SAM-dependent methyltransferase